MTNQLILYKEDKYLILFFLLCYLRTYLLDFEDPLFKKIGGSFIKAVSIIFIKHLDNRNITINQGNKVLKRDILCKLHLELQQYERFSGKYIRGNTFYNVSYI